MSWRDRIARRLITAAGERDIFYRWAHSNPDRAIAAADEADAGRTLVDMGERRKQAAAQHRAEFPWLHDPVRGVRWDFDPVLLRNVSQESVWVGMLVESIATEVAGTPWHITDAEDDAETAKRLGTSPFARERVEKADGADDLHDLLAEPNPDHDWNDLASMWMADLLEVGSAVGVKGFPEAAFTTEPADDETVERSVPDPAGNGSISWEYTIKDDIRPRVDLADVRPLHIQPHPPEVWTKEYADRTGVLSGFWQFDRVNRPGTGSTDRGQRTRTRRADPIHFDRTEVIWRDNANRTNRRYGLPPTLLVQPFLQMLDLAIEQESNYFSKGSLPSGALVFEEYKRQEAEDLAESIQADVKGKPHKWLHLGGKGGSVDFLPFSYNLEEMQFAQRMEWYARVVSSAFQVPIAMVGLKPDEVNRATFQGERSNFESNTLGPYLQLIERTINAQVVWPHWGRDLRFEFVAGMSEDARQGISSRVLAEVQAGVKTPNEARRELGDEPSDEEGADTLGPVSGATEEPEEVALSKDEPLREAGPDAQAFTVQPGMIDDLLDDIEPAVREAVDAVIHDDEVLDIVDELSAPETEKSLTDLTRRIEALVRDMDVTDAIVDAVTAHRAGVAEAAVSRAITQTGEDVDISEITDRLTDRDVTFARDFAERMSEDIRETVADGWAEGKSTLEIADDLEAKSDEFTGWGAEKIARQETHIAAGEARSEFARQTGKVEVWLTAEDDRVRDAHADMHMTYKRPAESWEVDYADAGRGIQRERVPGDSEPGIGCRCDVLLVDFEDLEGMGVDPGADHRGV